MKISARPRKKSIRASRACPNAAASSDHSLAVMSQITPACRTCPSAAHAFLLQGSLSSSTWAADAYGVAFSPADLKRGPILMFPYAEAAHTGVKPTPGAHTGVRPMAPLLAEIQDAALQSPARPPRSGQLSGLQGEPHKRVRHAPFTSAARGHVRQAEPTQVSCRAPPPQAR